MSARTCVYVCGPIQRNDISLKWQIKYNFQRSDKTTEELPIPVSSQLHKVGNMDDNFKNKIIIVVLNTEHKTTTPNTSLLNSSSPGPQLLRPSHTAASWVCELQASWSGSWGDTDFVVRVLL